LNQAIADMVSKDNKKKRISFILSGPGNTPTGGVRVVYEYANRLAERGWQVNIVHPARWERTCSFSRWFHSSAGYIKRKIFHSYKPTKWLTISGKINVLWVLTLHEKNIPDADYIVACPFESARPVSLLSGLKGEKYYFIQHFEDWAASKGEVITSWHFPLRKIVISKWLLELAANIGEKAVFVPNGLDFQNFYCTRNFDDRPEHSILFLTHMFRIKGCDVAIEAMKILKTKYPDLFISSFGVYPRPKWLPDFVTYNRNPNPECLRTLYNSARIYLTTSRSEGWPLPPAEAIRSGCVVVASNIPGHREYLIENVNCVFCLPDSVSSTVERIEYLFQNQSLLKQLAKSARTSIEGFKWDSSTDMFENAILQWEHNAGTIEIGEN
jgi:glycosyltransferase involved in cell wall biosynthesis